MNVQELRYVVAVAQAGSINKAALNLYVSQSTLSRAVQEVEAQIGISLFQRTNKGAIPTHDGLEFIERARRLLLAFDQLEGQYFNHEKAEQETLLVATQRCTPVISAFIEYYQKRCEDKKLLNLALKEDTTDNIIRLVSNRIYGIGILHYTSDQESSFLHKCRSVDLESHLLEVSPVVAQVRYGHPLANRKSILVRELRPYPHVTFADEDITNINYCSDVSQYNPSILEKTDRHSGSGHAAADRRLHGQLLCGLRFYAVFHTGVFARVYSAGGRAVYAQHALGQKPGTNALAG